MRFHDQWWNIVKKAWSFKLNLLAILLSGLEVWFSFVDPGTLPDWMPPGTFAALAMLTTMAANFARLIAQKELK
jgi:hypothetical protein